MNFVSRSLARRILVTLSLATLLPLMNGCSVFGIATSGDLNDAENRMQADQRRTDQRLDAVEENSRTARDNITNMSARIDSLNAEFGQAAEWIQSLDFEGISRQASDASEAAAAIREQNRLFMAKYLEWLKAQQALITQQVEMLEAKVNASGTAYAPEPEQSEPSGTNQ